MLIGTAGVGVLQLLASFPALPSFLSSRLKHFTLYMHLNSPGVLLGLSPGLSRLSNACPSNPGAAKNRTSHRGCLPCLRVRVIADALVPARLCRRRPSDPHPTSELVSLGYLQRNPLNDSTGHPPITRRAAAQVTSAPVY